MREPSLRQERAPAPTLTSRRMDDFAITASPLAALACFLALYAATRSALMRSASSSTCESKVRRETRRLRWQTDLVVAEKIDVVVLLLLSSSGGSGRGGCSGGGFLAFKGCDFG